MNKEIKFVCNTVKWFDKINGNTYHSVKIIRCKDGKEIVGQFQYGYGEQYKHTAINEMAKNKWINSKYEKETWLFESQNNYPILWNVRKDTKKECKLNGEL